MNVLEKLALSQAVESLSKGDLDGCQEWLDRVPIAERPPELLGEIHDKLSRNAAAQGQWSKAISEAVAACGVCRTPLRQERLELLRKRSPQMDVHQWSVMTSAVDPAHRLDSDLLTPEIDQVYACGAYFSRGADSGAPWSRFLRMGKAPSEDQRNAVLSLAGGYFSRFLVERTPLMSTVEVLVPIPANPARYVGRMMSLPDELASTAGASCALPVILGALELTVDIELRGLTRRDRREAMSDAFGPGPDFKRLNGRAVLLVDDILTSGATLKAAARFLRTEADVPSVSALVLAHTEG